MDKKSVRRFSKRLLKKLNKISKYKRMSRYHFDKDWRRSEYHSPLDTVKAKRFSRHDRLKTRVFDRNMVDGLCFGKFYGRDRVVYQRKYGKKILQGD